MRRSRLARLGLTPRAILKLVLWLPRTRWPYLVFLIAIDNIGGAILVFGFLWFGLPPSDAVHLSDLGNRNTQVIFGGFLTLITLITAFVGFLYALPALIWHYGRRRGPWASTAKTRALRIPAMLFWASASQWFLGGLLFVGFLARHSLRLAIIGAIASAFGGACTSMILYLRAEQVLRPVTATAIASGGAAGRVGRVSTRLLAVWLLCSGVPVLGVFSVAAGYEVGVLQGSADRLILPILVLAAVAIVVGFWASVLVTGGVGRSIRFLRDAMLAVEQGDYNVQVAVDDTRELGLLQTRFNTMVRQLDERERLSDMFGKFVGPDVARRALEQGVDLGGEERYVAVLFVDLVGSTRLAFSRPAEEVVDLLNEFFRAVVDIVRDEGGFVNKFQGDAALAIFGAPLELEDFAGHALRAARRLRAELVDVLGELEVGIGVSAGKVIAGHIGARERFEYTVIGDAVNEAARLCELAKSDSGHLLASARAVLSSDPEEMALWDVGKSVVLRGRGSPTQVAWPRE